MTDSEELKYLVSAPLFSFKWDGDLFLLNGFGKIERMRNFKEFISDEFNYYLSECECENMQNVTHWLVFEQKDNERISHSEKINIFQLALWIANPTKTQVRLVFINKRTVKTFVRFLDMFLKNKLIVISDINNNCLEEVNRNISTINDIYLNRKRLFNSLILNLNGCFSSFWQVAFISFSASVEGILTYKTGPGITKRLAKSFACLTETDNKSRDHAYKLFCELYNIRSDIVHGRAMNFNDPKINLRYLANYEDLLRKLWKLIFNSKVLLEELEKDDLSKEKFFTQIEKGYTPPKL